MRILCLVPVFMGGCLASTMVRTGPPHAAYDATHSIEFVQLTYAVAAQQYDEVGRLCVDASQDTWSQPGRAHDDIVEKAQALGGDVVTVVDSCTLGFDYTVKNDALKIAVFRKR